MTNAEDAPAYRLGYHGARPYRHEAEESCGGFGCRREQGPLRDWPATDRGLMGSRFQLAGGFPRGSHDLPPPGDAPSSVPPTEICEGCGHYSGVHAATRCAGVDCSCGAFRRHVPAKRAAIREAHEEMRRAYERPSRFSFWCRVLGRFGGHRYGSSLLDGEMVALGLAMLRGRECRRCGSWEFPR